MSETVRGTETAAPPRPGGLVGLVARVPVRAAMKAALFVQVLLFGALVWADVDSRDPFDGGSPIAPRVQAPFAPGDQVRPWSPGAAPRDPSRADDPAPPMPAPQEGLTFALETLPGFGRVALLRGAFQPGDAARFGAFLDRQAAPPDRIAFHSPGGVVQEAMEIGRMIRARGIATLMRADETCASACPLAFAGGEVRTASREAWIGVHQSYLAAARFMVPNEAAHRIQILKAETMEHWDAMGVDPALEALAMKTPQDRMYYLVEEELSRFALATHMID